MRKKYILMCLLGFLMACTSPIERMYNKETAMKDMQEIKNSIEISDFELLENGINNLPQNLRELKNKTYLQILDSIKAQIQKEREMQIERQRLALDKPIQLSNATYTGFEEFNFSLFGKETKTIGYIFIGSFINISDKTFVKVEFEDSEDSFWADAKRNPYVEINLNNKFRLSCVNFGPRFDNWTRIKDIDLPLTSYEKPWGPNKIKSFEMYFQPDVTCGYFIGVNDYGECLKPIHFSYEPNSCTLNIPIYVEDSKGYKKQMFLSFDIMNDFNNFAKTNLKKD